MQTAYQPINYREYHLKSSDIKTIFPLQNLKFEGELPVGGPTMIANGQEYQAIEFMALIDMIVEQNQDYIFRDIAGQSSWKRATIAELLKKHTSIDFEKWSGISPTIMNKEELAFHAEYNAATSGVRGRDHENDPGYCNLWHKMLDLGFGKDRFRTDSLNDWSNGCWTLEHWPSWCQPTIALLDRLTKDHPARNDINTQFWVEW